VDSLSEVIMANITLPTVTIDGYITMQVFEPNGVELLRGALAELAKPIDGDGDTKASIQVIGPPRYRVTLEAEDYKTAESMMQSRVESTEAFLKGYDYRFEFSRSSK
jgi:translation initiation factor 2 subunit 1